ncbi:sensor histidine kinase [Qipengyuania marisflavi]|uniref:histidine kinase n=1 Tax=Qipengyuania marisflavi TaxID=2486356 RepID=A0A5S3P8Y9_9SPHN|nr:ATP-binding protein [Qipengyuania marisflavi]TMM49783.1 two-component sensor histidine kinase [Qipengyuania marisflavi]
MASRPIPVPAIAIALTTCVILLLLGFDWVAVVAVLLVWLGSLWLVGDAPPPIETERNGSPFLRDTMDDLVEHSETPVLVTEGDRVTIANLAARKLLGAHVLGQDVRMALRQPEAVRLIDRDGDGVAVVRGLARRRDIWRINRKKLDYGLAVIEFVNKTAEADISRAHTDFVANASHELRTPLSSIIGYVETLREGGDELDSATANRFQKTILREARRLQALVSDLMSLSRIEAEKHELPEDHVELAALAERAAQDGAGADDADRIAFSTPHGFTVRGDTQQLEQLVRNLVENACKYGTPETPVAVTLEPVGDNRVSLSVADQGEGIASEHLPHLTRRFYRTDPGRSRASGGTGLGLAIVKHIVERHRGRMDITSAPGQGTKVTVELPLAPEEPGEGTD